MPAAVPDLSVEPPAADLADGSDPASTLVSGPMPEPDLAAATDAARSFLTALGVDLSAPGLDRTPLRMARAYAEMFHPRPFEMTTFANDEGYDEMVVAHGIGFTSVCEHHLLPFSGHATVGYLPGERIVGLSKLARVVELFARRPQVQERMTQQVARFLADRLAPKGVGVVLVAEHSCMTVRGVQAQGSSTTTSALLGRMREDARTRAEFLALSGR
ncbi:GTP cyclohydrolase I FolE [Aquipuribacter sp. MA13-6]|uniref:GTP cyclohydrolase I FolE n=1 Tax=unclassified Aquipuribacter TaxID=2635084 RepID=UPI003EEBAB8F